ncbi:MAG: 50S ribosomal protein L21 [Candidatus Sericytochromatia bacterium]|nr:50S ribosomal protein L21 [Candidatus Sericytochromatia bacterium]
MYAIIETGGKQIKVEEGRYIDVEKLPAAEGETIEFDRVLMVVGGDDVKVGAPVVAGAKVVGKVQRQWKGPKLIVYKMRPKKHYRRKNHHRQPYTRVMIEAIKA